MACIWEILLDYLYGVHCFYSVAQSLNHRYRWRCTYHSVVWQTCGVISTFNLAQLSSTTGKINQFRGEVTFTFPKALSQWQSGAMTLRHVQITGVSYFPGLGCMWNANFYISHRENHSTGHLCSTVLYSESFQSTSHYDLQEQSRVTVKPCGVNHELTIFILKSVDWSKNPSDGTFSTTCNCNEPVCLFCKQYIQNIDTKSALCCGMYALQIWNPFLC